jgi:hypothetical protein
VKMVPLQDQPRGMGMLRLQSRTNDERRLPVAHCAAVARASFWYCES